MFGQRTTYVDPATDEIKINDDPDVQIGTAYSQLDVLQKLTYSINDTWQLTANFQYSTSSDIPRYDQLSVMDATGEFEYSEWHYGPQRRMLGSLRADFHGYSRLFDQSQFILAYQRINEDRVTRVFRNPLRREQNERVDVMTFNADFTKYLDPNKQHALMYGLEGHYNHVNSEAFGTDITSGEKNIPILSRYPSDGSNMLDGGIYALWVWKLDGWTLQSGSRISWHKLEVRYDENDVFNWPTYFYEGIDQSNTSFTWMAGLRKAWKSGTRMRMSGGTAFRAPNVDDFAKVRIKSNNISIPNPNLGPEKTINAELGIAQKLKLERSWMEYVDLSVTGFYSHMSDAIIRVPFAMPNGDSIYISDDRTLRIEANTNASTAYIVGVSSELKIQSTKGFSFNASINWLRGRSKLDGTESPLAHIPPIYGKVECQYEKSRWGIILNYTYNGKKKLEDFAPGSSDNEEYATPEGSLAWQTFNIYGHYSISDRLKLRIGAENLADIHYRPFSSGLSAAGRNLKVGIYGSF
jgi:hemoglobin/transferrin/lactoferrin receptor protein